MDEIRTVFQDVIRKTVTPELAKIKKRLTSLETEIWNTLKGAGGTGPDPEWSEELEALKNWQDWGTAGSGYGHLPVVFPEELERRSSESEDMRGVSGSSSVQGEAKGDEDEGEEDTQSTEGEMTGDRGGNVDEYNEPESSEIEQEKVKTKAKVKKAKTKTKGGSGKMKMKGGEEKAKAKGVEDMHVDAEGMVGRNEEDEEMEDA